MNWNYDELFAVNNVIGVEGSDGIKVASVDEYNMAGWKMTYGNECLKSRAGKIVWIVRMNDEGEVAERIFDRDEDMADPMPELKTGMFVSVYTDIDKEDGLAPNIGVIVGNHVVYDRGGWDYICSDDSDDVTNYVIKVWGEDCTSFSLCRSEEPIWERNN